MLLKGHGISLQMNQFAYTNKYHLSKKTHEMWVLILSIFGQPKLRVGQATSESLNANIALSVNVPVTMRETENRLENLALRTPLISLQITSGLIRQPKVHYSPQSSWASCSPKNSPIHTWSCHQRWKWGDWDTEFCTDFVHGWKRVGREHLGSACFIEWYAVHPLHFSC